MNSLNAYLQRSVAIGLALMVAFCALYPLQPVLSFVIGSVYPGYFCQTRNRGSLSGLAGHDFEINETACDVIAKDDAITVVASQTGKKEKTAIFTYDPGRDERPKIVAIDAHTVRISLQSPSSIFFRNDFIGDLSVVHDIGHIDYPNASPAKVDAR
jgi:hypothetical protein